MSEFVWGTVTALSPLRVQLDGDTAALDVTPDSLVDPLTLAVATRVRCELSRRRVIVHGPANPVRSPFAFAAGALNISHPANTANVTGITITLPVGRFTVAPIAAAVLSAAAGGSAKCVPRIYASTTSALTAGIYQGDQTAANGAHNDNLSWHAVQMTSGAAAG